MNIVKEIESRGLKAVRFSFADQHGVLRGKTLAASEVKNALERGVTVTSTLLLKDTSQTSIITVAELSFQGRLIASSTFKNTEIFTLVAVWYLAMCVPLILLVGRLEKKFGRK